MIELKKRLAPVMLMALLLAACASPATVTPSLPTAAPTSAPEATTAATAPAATSAAATSAATEAATANAPTGEATQAVVPTATSPAGGQAPAATVDDLSKIKSAGKIIVGTSADYPPYAYYNSQYQVDGFDPALITELGKRIGVQVEMNDFAFEGVLSALQLGQIDAAIAALVPTGERRQLADFSDVYFIGADAVLGRSDAATLTSVAQLAGKKVGVQRGSVYATFLKEQLVEKGLSSETNIFQYLDTDKAISGLQDKTIDYFMLDRLPAQTLAQSRGLKVVGENFSPQRFAIAVRKGSNLRGALNDALLQAQNDGTVQKLIAQYLNLQPNQVEPITPATPEPTPTAGPQPTVAPPVCVDGMAWVADLSFDDRNMTAPPQLQPGLGFTKGWRLRNSGNCDWTADFTLRYIFGNVDAAQMGGSAIAIGRVLNPDQTIDLTVNLIAPAAPGTYQGFWQMYNSAGNPFGERVWVGITVPGAPTPPPPPPTPIPPQGGVIDYFTADQSTINYGQGVTFRWSTQNVAAVYFYQSGQNYTCCGRPGVSVETVYPQTSGTWELRVQKNDGNVEIRQIYVVVNGSGITPPNGGGSGPTNISYFQASPIGNGCVTLQWSISGQLQSVSITRDNAPISTPQTATGSTNDCPGSGQHVYTLVASWGPNDSLSSTRSVVLY